MQWFALAGSAAGIYYLVALFPLCDQLGDDLWRVLEVGVDYYYRVAGGMVETGGRCLFVTKVATEEDVFDVFIGGG